MTELALDYEHLSDVELATLVGQLQFGWIFIPDWNGIGLALALCLWPRHRQHRFTGGWIFAVWQAERLRQ